MNAESWFFAQEAVDAGLADRLADPKERPTVPEGIPPEDLTATAIMGFRYANREQAPTFDPELFRRAFTGKEER